MFILSTIRSWFISARPVQAPTPVATALQLPNVPGPSAASSRSGPRDYYIQQGDPRFVPYPKQEPLLRALTVDELLEPHAKLLRRIDVMLGLREDGFQRIVMPMLRRFADYANLIPASQSDHHCEAGGLLHHSLEVAFFAARLADGSVFAFHETPERRRAIEPLWRFAAFVGGLVHDIGKAMESVEVTCPDQTRRWNPATQTLTSWLSQQGITGFRMTWDPDRRHKSHEKYSSMLCSEILGEAGRDYLLSVEGAGVHRALLEALYGDATRENLLPGIIVKADQMSVDEDFAAMRANQTPATSPQRMGYRLMHLAKQRVLGGFWRPNTPGQPIWVTPDGVFAVVPAFYAGIEAAADAANEQGIPRIRSRLAAELTRAMLIEANADGDPVLTTLLLPTHAGRTESEVAIRILRPDLLFGDVPPPPPVNVCAPTADRQSDAIMQGGRSSPGAGTVRGNSETDEVQEDLFRNQFAARRQDLGSLRDASDRQVGVSGNAADQADAAAEWLKQHGVAGEILRAILDANLATTGPVQVHLHAGQVLVETTGLVQQIGFASAQVIRALQEERWLERSAQGQQLRYAFEVLVHNRACKVFAINREVSAMAVQYAPRLFDASHARPIADLPQPPRPR